MSKQRKPTKILAYCTIETFAEKIQSSPSTVRQMIDRKVISHIRVKRFIRIPLFQALRELEQYRVNAVSTEPKRNNL
jgi:hypothetical protein